MASNADLSSLTESIKIEFPRCAHDIINHPGSPRYNEETKAWSAQRNLHPQLVLCLQSLPQVQLITAHLFQSSLDFAVRNGGVGSASARDVLISLADLNKVEFDETTETVTVGAGATWSHVDAYMEKEAPGYAVVGSRTPFVGVTGQVLIGGLSWLSHEFGLVSDPQNLLDAHIVLGDGRAIWASREADLLWAIRGGRCAFGVITRLVLRARQYKTDGIYLAQIKYPLNKLKEVSAGVAKQVAHNTDPRLAFHAFLLNHKSPLFDSSLHVGLMVFDARGESHARSREGFKWAFDIDEVVVEGREMSLYEVNQQTDFAKALMGKFHTFDATGLITDVDNDILIRADIWFRRVLKTNDAFAAASYCLIEFTQPAAFGSTKTSSATAWPHDGRKHVLQLGVGYPPTHRHLNRLALKLLSEAYQEIPQTPLSKGGFKPTFLEPSLMDIPQMYGVNHERLRRIADYHDPKRRFRSLFTPDASIFSNHG